MDVTRRDFDELVGAYALDAVDADEAEAIEAYVGVDPDARAELDRLRAAAAWIGAVGAVRPPASLRDRLLTVAHEPPAVPVDAFVAETQRLEALLETLSDDDLEQVTYNGLRARELVAHLAALDQAFADELAVPRRAFIGADEVVEITRAALPHAPRGRDALLAHWRGARDALAAAGRDAPAGAHAAGYPVGDVLLVRAFETWTHHDDLRAALGRPPAPPAPPVLRAMADLSMRSLPFALAASGRPRPGRRVRVVLTGAGGGRWTVPGAPGEPVDGPADAELRADVVDWCRRVADRLAPGDLPHEASGDLDLVRDLLAAAPAFAGL